MLLSKGRETVSTCTGRASICECCEGTFGETGILRRPKGAQVFKDILNNLASYDISDPRPWPGRLGARRARGGDLVLVRSQKDMLQWIKEGSRVQFPLSATNSYFLSMNTCLSTFAARRVCVIYYSGAFSFLMAWPFQISVSLQFEIIHSRDGRHARASSPGSLARYTGAVATHSQRQQHRP